MALLELVKYGAPSCGVLGEGLWIRDEQNLPFKVALNGQKAAQIMACKCKFDLPLIIRATNLAALK